ncbi:hypothetical protein THIOM_001159 [Candidatus Thiomargarita nelsonii]|uniref:Uncharacterized protein n=1 Tax=Candidatus Thiomargarita nelsonii TaxID=1003181 RepID=A0A176S4Z5_9GAMM|nr:hypothetical protein THIOM_001159 [Candidatus Thiomargarita nelsonii]
MWDALYACFWCMSELRSRRVRPTHLGFDWDGGWGVKFVPKSAGFVHPIFVLLTL